MIAAPRVPSLAPVVRMDLTEERRVDALDNPARERDNTSKVTKRFMGANFRPVVVTG
jgi:hypothetical protein